MMTEYNPDTDPMSDDELDYYLDQLKGTNLEEFAPRLKSVYQRLRAEVAEDEVPDTFKQYIKDELELDE